MTIRARRALALVAALLAACDRPCGALPPPATGGSADDRALVDAAMAAFAERVIPAARCVASVEVVDAIVRDDGIVYGSYNWGTGALRIAHVGHDVLKSDGTGTTRRWTGPEYMERLVHHESCHAVDDGLDLSGPRGSPFRPAGATRREAAERLAAWCEDGLASLELVRAAAEACGPQAARAEVDAILSALEHPVDADDAAVEITPGGTWSPPTGEVVDVDGVVWWEPNGRYAVVGTHDADGARTRSFALTDDDLPGDPSLPHPEEVEDALASWLPPDWTQRSGALLPDGSVGVARRRLPDGSRVWGMFAARGDAMQLGPCLEAAEGRGYAVIPAAGGGAWWFELTAGEVTWWRVRFP